MNMKKFYIYEIAAVNLSKIDFFKNAKKTCKPNNHDLTRNWMNFEIENFVFLTNRLILKQTSPSFDVLY